MARTKTTTQTILTWALGIGGFLVILFALLEYGFGMRMFAEEGDPAITDTTISDFEDHNDDVAFDEPAEPGVGEVDIGDNLGGFEPVAQPEAQAKP